MSGAEQIWAQFSYVALVIGQLHVMETRFENRCESDISIVTIKHRRINPYI
ncbi:hypothetical protein LH823_001841 [Salmonella enterica]|nr:hypothetical protein [Salmonella enterica]